MGELIIVCVDAEFAVLNSLQEDLNPNEGCIVAIASGLDQALTLLQASLTPTTPVALVTAQQIDLNQDIAHVSEYLQQLPWQPNLLLIRHTCIDAMARTMSSLGHHTVAVQSASDWQGTLAITLFQQLRCRPIRSFYPLRHHSTPLAELDPTVLVQTDDVRQFPSPDHHLSVQDLEILNRDRVDMLMKHHLAELIAWQSRYEAAGQASGQILYEWNGETDQNTWGPNTEQILGYTANEMPITLKDWLALMHPSDRPIVASKIESTIAARASFKAEYRLQHKDGGYIWVEDRSQFLPSCAGDQMRAVGFIADISSRKQAAAALQASEAQFRKLVENLQVGVLLQGPQAEILICNSKALDLLGLTEDQLLGRTSFDPDWNVIHEDGSPFPGSDHPVPQAIATRQPIRNVVMGVYRPNQGDRIWLLVNADPQIDPDGNVYQVLCTFSDISDRKRIESELQQAKEAAEAANLAKGAFLTNMSHELRTPLNAVLGFTQLLDSDPSLNAQQREYLGIILRSGEHLLKLINDVLEMSKIDAGRITLEESEFDLSSLLTSLVEMLQLKAASKSLQLNLELAATIPRYIRTDEKKLRQILVNLLSNAIKFTDVGSVTLRVRGRTTPSIQNETIQNGAIAYPSPNPIYEIEFEVEDTGPGIATTDMPHLFDAFVQTSVGQQSGQGTGLGLTISRRFVELMGGEITVESQVQQGALFRFYIPVQVNQPPPLQAQPETGHIVGLQPGEPICRILVVEDQVTNRMLVTRLLSKIGFEVEEATNGEEAIAQYQRWLPHLILMDMQMPVMDGYEATRIIHQWCAEVNQPSPKIVALTASVFEEQRSPILEAGCDDVVSKPFRVKNLLLTIGKHLGVHYIYG
ncbi:PAS domain S-box protein [Oscillatoria sp. FACHB-1407]|uniref:PAS domain S-box protein n=1 Tax=Oscillatoria sp. FACHB-1407 TaxID=2692847 RepID=UPI00168306B1|nr:PAS domain S-box protein [Oscillatoria sp. FACHB-1407]MBD2462837.1 PAS domain S-box protein [Oscillatoria sp. FACHB-1407]